MLVTLADTRRVILTDTLCQPASQSLRPQDEEYRLRVHPTPGASVNGGDIRPFGWQLGFVQEDGIRLRLRHRVQGRAAVPLPWYSMTVPLSAKKEASPALREEGLGRGQRTEAVVRPYRRSVLTGAFRNGDDHRMVIVPVVGGSGVRATYLCR